MKSPGGGPRYELTLPDCRRCIKQRIKCDRSTPQCLKCGIRKFGCPGFGHLNLRWHYESTGKAKWAIEPRSSKSPNHSSSNEVRERNKLTRGLANDYVEYQDRSQDTVAKYEIPLTFASMLAPNITSDLDLTKRHLSNAFANKLLYHFYLEVSPRLTWIDSPDNPWRNKVLPLAQHSKCLQPSLLSLSAAHLAATSSGGCYRATDITELNERLRILTLQALNNKMRSELKSNRVESGRQIGASSLTELMRSMLVLCHREMLVPDSTEWTLHLRACHTAMNRHAIQAQKNTEDSIVNFLIEEAADLETFGDVSAFE